MATRRQNSRTFCHKMLERAIIKQALLGASEILAHRASEAERQRAAAFRRAQQLQLLADLEKTRHRSSVGMGLKGALMGATAVGLPLVAPSLYYKNPAWAIGGAAAGALGGGMLGAKVPGWANDTLKDYAHGTSDPVFYDESHEVAEAPLKPGDRGLIKRLLRGRHG